MSTESHSPTASNDLATGKLRTIDIVFFVVSAAVPLTVAVSSAPLSFRVGGIGAPGAMLASGVVLILFAVGFTAMSRFVRNTWAFHAYAAAGLGKPIGIGVAFVTIVAYAFLCVGFFALLGFYAGISASHLLGLEIPWWVWSGASVLLIGLLDYRRIDVGARVLAVLLTAEIAIFLVFSIAVIAQNGSGIIEGPLLPSPLPKFSSRVGQVHSSCLGSGPSSASKGRLSTPKRLTSPLAACRG